MPVASALWMVQEYRIATQTNNTSVANHNLDSTKCCVPQIMASDFLLQGSTISLQVLKLPFFFLPRNTMLHYLSRVPCKSPGATSKKNMVASGKVHALHDPPCCVTNSK